MTKYKSPTSDGSYRISKKELEKRGYRVSREELEMGSPGGNTTGDTIRKLSDSLRRHSRKASEKLMDAEKLRNKYSNIAQIDTYKNPRTIKGLDKIGRESLKLYQESLENYQEAEKESELAARVARSAVEAKRQRIAATKYLGNAVEIKKKIRKLEKEMGIKKSDSELEEIVDEEGHSLFFPVLAMLAFFFALVSSSFSITGFLISDTTNSVANYITLACFIVGLIIAIIYMKRVIKDKVKEQKKKKAKKKSKSKKSKK